MFGYAISFTSSTQSSMEGDLIAGVAPPDYLVQLTKTEESWYASLLNVGCILGAFSGAFLSDRLGRRRTLVLTALPHLIAWSGTGYASGGFPVLIILRLLLGWGVGVGSAVTPVYIGEIATTSLRGSLGAANQLSVTFGIFLTNFLGAYVCTVEHQGQQFTEWKIMSYVGAGITLLLLGVIMMPESPAWLAKKQKPQEAEAALRKLRKGDISQELQDLLAESSQSSTSTASPTQSSVSLFHYSRSLIIGIGMLTFQQLSGVNAVIMYAADICKSAGLGDGKTAAMAIMGIQVILTAISCMLMERAGRRLLLLFGSMSMALGQLILGYYFLAQDVDGLVAPSSLALAGLGIFIVGFGLSLGPIPWLLLAEIFPTEVRSVASAIGTAQNWLMSFVVTLVFLPVQEAITKQGTFFGFAVVCLICYLFVLVFVPETKGKSIDEVLKMLQPSRGGDLVGAAISLPRTAMTRVSNTE